MGNKDLGEYMQIGEAIRSARRAAGLTQRAAAAKLQIPVSTYSNYENGHRTPKTDTLERIAAAFGISVDEILRRESDLVGWHDDRLFAWFFENRFRKEIEDNEDFKSELVTDLLIAFLSLNDAGRQKALERVEELTEVPKYHRTTDQEADHAKEE